MFLQCFINKQIKALFPTLQITDQTIYTSGEFPVQMILFALNTHLLYALILYFSVCTCMLLLLINIHNGMKHLFTSGAQWIRLFPSLKNTSAQAFSQQFYIVCQS